jgi:hypothetical protein
MVLLRHMRIVIDLEEGGCYQFQRVNILTQLYVYYGCVTRFGPYLDHHQAIV